MMRRRRVLGAAAFTLIAVLATACSTGGSNGGGASTNNAGSTATGGGGGGTVTGKISIAYLQKQADQQYFVDEANGAKAKAKELGADITMYDLGTDTNKTIDQLNAAIAKKPTGIIIVPPDGSVGPQVISTANSAKIKIISSDDQVCSNNPDPTKCDPANLLPRVGFSGEQMGTDVGKKAAELYKAAGWAPADTAILSEWQQDVTVCTQRVDAAYAAFKANGGDASIKKIDVGTDNSVNGALDKTSAILTANQNVKHWVVWGCNDENVSGTVQAMENAKINTNDIIGVGLGAYLACKPWKANQQTGMKAALYIGGKDVGSTAVQVMYDWLTKGQTPKAETFAPTKMVDASNWQSTGMTCD